MTPAPRLVLSFTGTTVELIRYLASPDAAALLVRQVSTQTVRLINGYDALGVVSECYDWELTASMSRHPAGKGLGRG